MYNDMGVPETVPIWEFGDNHQARLVRPTIYWRQAVAAQKHYENQGYLGLMVKTAWGELRYMSWRTLQRLKDTPLMNGPNAVTVVDFYRNHHLPSTIGLSGADTECAEAVFKYG